MADKKTEDQTQQTATGFMDELAGQGFERMGASDFAIPFLKILQMQSPEVIEGDPARVEGAKAGMFMNTLTKRVYGAEIELIPIKYESVWLSWAPNRGGLRGRCEPGAIEVTGDPFNGMKDKDGNDVVENMIFYCLVAGHVEDGPIVFALSSTGLKHGKNWNAQILMTRLESGKRAPYFSSVWKLTLVLNKNDSGSWYQIGTKTVTNATRTRFITPQDYLDAVQPNRKMLDEGSKRMDYAAIEAPKGQIDRDAGKSEDY